MWQGMWSNTVNVVLFKWSVVSFKWKYDINKQKFNDYNDGTTMCHDDYIYIYNNWYNKILLGFMVID